MLPLQIILILGILFLLVLCRMIAAQLTTGRMPNTDDEVVRSSQAAWPVSQHTRLYAGGRERECEILPESPNLREV